MREAPAGVGVGYGHTFVTERPTRLAVVPVGYADGFRRGLSNQGAVLVGGRRVRVAGRVSMDQTVLALGPDVDAQVGDDVVLLGRQGDEVITAEDWAGWLGTISYEVVTGLGARIPRRYRGG
jgi:alanine racemase